MPKLKIDDDELPLDELEGAEYNDGGDFAPYEGEDPPAGKLIPGLIKSMWWTYSAPQTDGKGNVIGGEEPMLKTLFVADENAGPFEGWPCWDNCVLKASTKFRWAPLLASVGLTIRDLKTKTVVDEDDDERFGAPITSIAGWKPGSDEAYVAVKTGREKWNGEWRTKAQTWLPYPEDLNGSTPAAAEEPEEPEEPEDEAVEEEPEETPPPRRSRGKASAAKPAASSGKGRRAASATASSGPRRGARRAQPSGDTEEPPF